MREAWVDYAKGVGIILVVFGHVNRGLYSAGIHLSESFYQLTDSVIYSFHMPLFFFLSGLFFVQSLDRKGKSRFIISKIDTIVYPYIIWSLLQGTVEVVLSRYTNNAASLKDLLGLFTHPRAQFWFLYALFMVFFIATLLYKKNKFNYILPVLIVISAGLYVYQDSLSKSYHFGYITSFMVFFLLGAFAIHYSAAIARINITTSLIAALVFVLLEWVFHGYLGLTYTDTGLYSMILAIAAIIFIISLSVLLAKADIVWLRRLGELSMVIYLMHILAASGLRIVLAKFLHVNNWSAHVLAGTLFGLIVPMVAYYFIQKMHLNFLLERPRFHNVQRKEKIL
ncbi:TPA: acyltransferase [Serratia liquefaciens]|jgi:fucose 4-O-acetylase-like acetyltransferase|uniref:acyltransferase family protein n=1 Tax=Serratia liquefaciens TaxID=614 RepID=UPI00165D1A57|nr:acyltransferase [Serratia liquefaciens]MDU5484415.1 acyltransferase [Serratia liquefaciens]QNQ56190.1 acyltransferase [Serratia liquefaciens]HEJ7039382.1 acyltransferase [Serratia liquefaciens]HEJ8022344.1 acyltransferase [Serratia liquefaciens]